MTSARVTWEVKDSTNRLKQKLIKYLDSLKESKNQGKADTAVQSTATNNTIAGGIVTMESKIKLEFELDDWEIFIERLDLFFTVNNVTTESRQPFC